MTIRQEERNRVLQEFASKGFDQPMQDRLIEAWDQNQIDIEAKEAADASAQANRSDSMARARDAGHISEDTFSRYQAAQPQLEPVMPPEPVSPIEPVEPIVPTPAPQPVANVVPDDPMAPFNESIAGQQQSIKDQANIQDMASMQLQKDRDAMADEVEANAKQIEDERIANAAEAKEEQGKIDTMVDSMSKEKYEGYWASKSTGSKILASLALAFGALGSAYGNGTNTALQIMNRAADDDFKVHQANSAKQLRLIGQARLSASDKIRLAKDEILGLQARQMANIKVMQFKIDGMAARTGSQVAKERANQMIAQLDQVAAEKRLQYDAAAEAMRAKRSAAQAKAGKLSNEERKSYDSLVLAQDGLRIATSAYNEGDWTFSPKGDNNFTRGRNMFVEGFGRLVSGAAIGKEEQEMFANMLPAKGDNADIQKRKLRDMKAELNRRLGAYKGRIPLTPAQSIESAIRMIDQIPKEQQSDVDRDQRASLQIKLDTILGYSNKKGNK